MQQVKLFHNTEDQVDALEQEINAWLKASGARIVQMSANIAPQTVVGTGDGTRISFAQEGASRRFAPSDLFVMVVYEPAKG